MISRTLISVLLSLAVLAVGVGTAGWLAASKPAPPTAPDARPAMLVRGVRIEPGSVDDRLVAFGTAAADRFARVSSEVNGVIAYLSDNLRPGAAVEPNEVLIRLDPREFEARLTRTKASLASDRAALAKLDIEDRNLLELKRIAQVELDVAQRELKRVTRLFENGLAGQREVDTAQLDVESKQRLVQDLAKQYQFLPETRRQHEAMVKLRQADVALAELNVERTVIRAPFGGRIEDVRVEEGERITAGSWLFSLLDPDLIEVPFEAPLAWHPRVAVGDPARLTLDANPDANWSGTVGRIAPSGDNKTRTFRLYVEVDNRRQAKPLLPGQFVKASIIVDTLEDAIALPRACVQDNAIFIYDDGVARRQPIKIERMIFDRCLVRDVDPGAIVITSNLDALSDGLPIRVDVDGEVLDHSAPALPVAQHNAPTASQNAAQ